MSKYCGPLVLVAVFLANFILGFGFRWYARTPFFDITLHFWGGWGVYLILHDFLLKKFPKAPPVLWSILMIGGTMLVGVLWEFAEYTGSVLLGPIHGMEIIGDLADTLADLLMDLLGATAAASSLLLHSFRKRKP